MPDENRVFDVAKPGQGRPQATSKPVIVGHHPVVNDPMMKDKDNSPATKISVHDDYSNLKQPETTAPAVFDSSSSSTPVDPLASQPAASNSFEHNGMAPLEAKPIEPTAPPPGHVEALKPSHVKNRHPFRWLIALLVLFLIAVYVLLGTRAINNSLNLPPFKKKAAVVTSPPASQSQTSQASLPAGFTKYNLSGTNITFAAPSSWGTPVSANDPGYSKRGTNIQSDGVHAYIVDFPNNKDVEVAVTSAKYLPAARDTLYYDYLQWCTGTADGKYYFSTLGFATAADKTQTPTTVTCASGPLTGVTPLNSTTIVQPALKSSNGQTLGDLYTKNLTNTSLPVIRIKDVSMKNGADIKLILGTVQSTGPATNSSPSNSSTGGQ